MHGPLQRSYATIVCIICVLVSTMAPTAVASPLRSKLVEAFVRASLTRFAEVYSRRDVDGIMASYSDSPSIVAVGANAEHGRFVGPEAIRKAYSRDLARATSIRMSFDDALVTVHDDVAWLVADGHACMQAVDGSMVAASGRLSAVLRRERGRWLFMMTHWSFPITVAGGP